MPRIDDSLRDLLIPINTRRASTPPSSAAESTESSPDAARIADPASGVNVCPVCGGAGFMTLNVPVTDPNFGRLIPCTCKLQQIQERNFAEMERLSMLEAFAAKTFQTFDTKIRGLDDAFARAQDYARNPSGWLLLWGNYGCGKTHLAAAIAIHATRNLGLKTLFTIVPDLLDHLRATYHPSSAATYDERFEAVRTVPLLVMDDLGAESPTPWAQEKLFQIINHRYNEQLPTVITSNVDLDRMDGRIRSRLCDQQLCRHVFIEAADYRQRDVPIRRPARSRSTPAEPPSRVVRYPRSERFP